MNTTTTEVNSKLSVTTDDNNGRLVAMYVKTGREKPSRTDEIVAGKVFADYDKHGKLVGVEVL